MIDLTLAFIVSGIYSSSSRIDLRTSHSSNIMNASESDHEQQRRPRAPSIILANTPITANHPTAPRREPEVRVCSPLCIKLFDSTIDTLCANLYYNKQGGRSRQETQVRRTSRRGPGPGRGWRYGDDRLRWRRLDDHHRSRWCLFARTSTFAPWPLVFLRFIILKRHAPFVLTVLPIDATIQTSPPRLRWT